MGVEGLVSILCVFSPVCAGARHIVRAKCGFLVRCTRRAHNRQGKMAPSGLTCPGIQKIPGSEEPGIGGAPEGIRTPNLLIRSQMLYPLSYRRMFLASDFFNPSRQQVILYGGYEEPASRKTQKGPIFGSPECCNASFYREIPGFLVPGKFFKIFLCGSKREVGSLRGDSPSRAILTLRLSNFSLITLGVFLLKV